MVAVNTSVIHVRCMTVKEMQSVNGQSLSGRAGELHILLDANQVLLTRDVPITITSRDTGGEEHGSRENTKQWVIVPNVCIARRKPSGIPWASVETDRR